ncbi:hypothetical protein [Streptomyces cavernae]|uniref:hypothetical protein n=1 Tax=Streptomyces cavernae TaxID=2259034 RepID=UPI0012D8675B|nr:hypothetical protein [Streptomyces cavernae]
MASLAWLIPLEAGLLQWVLLGAVIVAALAAWTTIRVFVRRLRRFPPPAAVALLTGFAVIFVVTPELKLAVEDPVTPVGGYVIGLLASAVLFAVLFAVVFGIALVATTYGFGELMRRAIGRAAHDLRNSPRVLGRALPPMLFVTLFLFFTSELWQVMNRLSWWRVALFVALFVGVTVLAAAGRLHDESGRSSRTSHRPCCRRRAEAHPWRL